MCEDPRRSFPTGSLAKEEAAQLRQQTPLSAVPSFHARAVFNHIHTFYICPHEFADKDSAGERNTHCIFNRPSMRLAHARSRSVLFTVIQSRSVATSLTRTRNSTYINVHSPTSDDNNRRATTRRREGEWNSRDESRRFSTLQPYFASREFSRPSRCTQASCRSVGFKIFCKFQPQVLQAGRDITRSTKPCKRDAFRAPEESRVPSRE